MTPRRTPETERSPPADEPGRLVGTHSRCRAGVRAGPWHVGGRGRARFPPPVSSPGDGRVPGSGELERPEASMFASWVGGSLALGHRDWSCPWSGGTQSWAGGAHFGSRRCPCSDMGHIHSVFLKLSTQKFCTRVKAPGLEGSPSEAVLPLVLGHTRCPALPAGAARRLTHLSRSTCCRVPVFSQHNGKNIW